MLIAAVISIIFFLFSYNYVNTYVAFIIAITPLLLTAYKEGIMRNGFIHFANRKVVAYEIDLNEDQIELLTIVANKIKEHGKGEVMLISTFSNLYLVVFTSNSALVEEIVKGFSADSGVTFKKVRIRSTCIKSLIRDERHDKDSHQTLKKAKNI